MSMLRTATSLLSFLVAGLIAAPAIAQSATAAAQSAAAATQNAVPAAPSAASAGATSMSIAVTVRDKHGNLVPNLTKDDFNLVVDGRPQVIQSVGSSAGLPLTIGLVEQTNLVQSGAVDAERKGSRSFLDTLLTAANDKAFLIQFDREVDLLADVSADKKKLDTALNQLGAPQLHNTSADQEGGEGSHRVGGSGTPLYDAIYLSSSEVIAKQQGRKVLIVVTDGIDRGSKVSLFTAIEAAQRANTAVYAIYLKGAEQKNNNNGFPGRRRAGMGYPGGGYPGGGGGYPGSGGGWPGGGGNRPTERPTEGSRTDGKKVMEQICGETGGRMFEVSKKATIDQLSPPISDELRARYMLQFAPDKQSDSGGFHRIVLTGKKKDWYVQARQGYYAGE